MFTKNQINKMKSAINECKNSNLCNSHVIEYIFWEAKKDAAWYWNPFIGSVISGMTVTA